MHVENVLATIKQKHKMINCVFLLFYINKLNQNNKFKPSCEKEFFNSILFYEIKNTQYYATNLFAKPLA